MATCTIMRFFYVNRATPPRMKGIEHIIYHNMFFGTCHVTKPMIYYRHTYISYISIIII